MLDGEYFQNINRCGYGFSFAIFHRLGQRQLVEQHVAELLGRADVELRPRQRVNLFGLGLAFAVEPLRHLGQNVAINLDSRVFHARQHRHQRQIYLFVNLLQATLFHLLAQNGAQSSRQIGALRQIVAEIETQSPQRDLIQAVVGISGIEQIGIKRRVVLHSG